MPKVMEANRGQASCFYDLFVHVPDRRSTKRVTLLVGEAKYVLVPTVKSTLEMSAFLLFPKSIQDHIANNDDSVSTWRLCRHNIALLSWIKRYLLVDAYSTVNIVDVVPRQGN